MTDTDLLRRTLAHIETHPDQWDQHAWAKRAECGTAYCFAGWAVTLTYPDAAPMWEGFSRTCAVALDGASVYIDDLAIELLGLGPKDAARLFDANNSLEDLRRIVGELVESVPAEGVTA